MRRECPQCGGAVDKTAFTTLPRSQRSTFFKRKFKCRKCGKISLLKISKEFQEKEIF